MTETEERPEQEDRLPESDDDSAQPEQDDAEQAGAPDRGDDEQGPTDS